MNFEWMVEKMGITHTSFSLIIAILQAGVHAVFFTLSLNTSCVLSFFQNNLSV